MGYFAPNWGGFRSNPGPGSTPGNVLPRFLFRLLLLDF